MARSTRSSSTSGASGHKPARAQVVVMAKHPSPGSVKTRLAAQLGATAACRLYTAFVGDLAERLPIAGLPVWWAIWPPGAPFETLVPGQRCFGQLGRDLGERLEAAMRTCLAAAPLPVIAIGADSPHLEPACLSEAADALAGEADVVLGPATDGGYYLIGLREPCPELFRGIAWGSSTVFDATLVRARSAGLRVHLLAPTFDVDDVDGLAALRALLARGAVDLPRTAAELKIPRSETSSRTGIGRRDSAPAESASAVPRPAKPARHT